MILNKEFLYSVKESKWNFISDTEKVNSYVKLENEKKLKKEDVKENVIIELMKNSCN